MNHLLRSYLYSFHDRVFGIKWFLVLASVWLPFALSAAPTGLREWTSSDGRTLSANATAFQDGKVTLVVKGGKLFTLPFEQGKMHGPIKADLSKKNRRDAGAP